MPNNATPARDPDLYDAIVIGGGVNGTSALRELARAGYRVLLAETEDLAAGASGRSSRMLHCGLRYFESPNPVWNALRHPLRFRNALGMARESMEARAELADDSNVATRPIELSFPVWSDGPYKRWQLDAGLRILEWLGPGKPSLSRQVLTGEAARTHPIGRHLRDPGDLRALVTFREYLFEAPERLCVNNALDAEAYGAELYLKTRAEIVKRDGEGNWLVALNGVEGKTVLRTRVVLNMAGSWADEVGKFPGRLICGTKGAHIVVRLPEGYADRGIATLHRGGHPFYGLPLGDDRFYFGPTETLYKGDAHRVRTEAEDLEFLLAEVNHLLPGLGLKRSDIEQCWAGVRPLTHDPERPMGARERKLHDLASQGFPNVLAMTAGPVMSHRSAGRRILGEARARLGAPLKPPALSQRPVQSGEDSMVFAVTREHARDLRSVLVSRTGTIWKGLVSRESARAVADKVAPFMGWDETETGVETERFLAQQAQEFSVPQDPNETNKTEKKINQQGEDHALY